MSSTYVLRTFGGVLFLAMTPPQNVIKRTLDCYNPGLGTFTLLQNETDPTYQPTLNAQGVAFVYSGYGAANFSMKFVRYSDGYLKIGNGAFTVDTVNNILYYAWGTTDTNMTGTWSMFLDVAMLAGGKRRYEDTVIIQPAP